MSQEPVGCHCQGNKSLPSMETVSSNVSTASSSSAITLIELKRSLVPPKWEESVRVLGMSECREAALSLAHAFAADEYAQYLVDPGDMSDGVSISAEDKWKLHVDIMMYAVAAHCLSGLVTATGPDYDSVALWYDNISVFYTISLPHHHSKANAAH